MMTRGNLVLTAKDSGVIESAPSNWSLLREWIWERDGGVCWNCSRHIDRKDYELGHLVDRVCGGSDEPYNVAVMCWWCNRMKPLHDTLPEVFAWRDTEAGGWFEVFNGLCDIYRTEMYPSMEPSRMLGLGDLSAVSEIMKLLRW